ncbi:hypothetical protein JXA32_03685 [Candidatus Sumerlaeota bacterium]|nr:hypothetical protein [Candidatus Sumerlaeota bacterium]
MQKETVQFIQSALPKGRTVFYSFPDRYALLLLQYIVGDSGKSVSALKRSGFAPLLNKNYTKQVLSTLSSDKLKSDDLQRFWPDSHEAFRLTLGSWPELDEKPRKSWDQTTRWGWNVVLQLNFASIHIRKLKELVADWKAPLEFSGHPISQGNELTLAWSRIDLDFETGEALIEEIQSDWVRDVKYYTYASWREDHKSWHEYFEKVLRHETKRWAETMLTAAIWFLVEELGLKTIFYHTHETGSKLKRISDVHPPKSIYSDLPRKFCFQVTHNGPLFIRDSARRELRKYFTDPDTKWHILNLNAT